MSLYSIIHGKVTREPYYRTGEGGKKSFLNLDVECGSTYKSWIDLTLFGETADSFANRVKTGDYVLATSNSVRGRGYTNQNGEAKASVNMIAATFQLVDSVGAANNAVSNTTIDDFEIVDF